MADPRFGGNNSTTVTMNPSEPQVDTTLRLDPKYIKTLPGLLKLAQLILNALGFICMLASGVFSYDTRGTWYNFVSSTGFIVTGLLFTFYLFHITDKCHRLPWIKFEFGYCAVWTLLYLIAAGLTINYGVEAYKAAGVFGFCAMLAYGIDTFVKYRAMKTRRPAQGNRAMT